MLRYAIWIVPIGGLLIGLSNMPYGYYELLRILLFCCAIFIAISERERGNSIWLWAFGACALIYNPIAKLSLGREIWTVVNLATIALLVVHFWFRGRLSAERME